MAKKLKTYNVEVKALKTAPTIDLCLDFLKKGKKVYELVKSMANDLHISLTDDKYKMSQLFPEDYQARTSFPTEDFVTDELTTMWSMFEQCKELTSLNVSNFNTSNVINMNNMFSWCESLTSLNLSNIDTSQVKSFVFMFYRCKNLAEIKGVIDLKSVERITQNISTPGWYGMFEDCPKLNGIKIKNPPADFLEKIAVRGVTKYGYEHAGLRRDQFEIVE